MEFNAVLHFACASFPYSVVFKILQWVHSFIFRFGTCKSVWRGFDISLFIPFSFLENYFLVLQLQWRTELATICIIFLKLNCCKYLKNAAYQFNQPILAIVFSQNEISSVCFMLMINKLIFFSSVEMWCKMYKRMGYFTTTICNWSTFKSHSNKRLG